MPFVSREYGDKSIYAQTIIHCILLEHERNYGLGMDAPVTVFSWNTFGERASVLLWKPTELSLGHGCSSHCILLNTNGMMVWAWMLESPCSLGTRTESWLGHGCSSHCILLKRTELWFGHGCSSHRILLDHERNDEFGMHALVTVFSGNTNGWSHAQTIIPFVFQENTVTGVSMSKP